MYSVIELANEVFHLICIFLMEARGDMMSCVCVCFLVSGLCSLDRTLHVVGFQPKSGAIIAL